MRVRVWAGAAVAAAALMPASSVSAQTVDDTVELPAVVVTTASPVVKPAKKKAKAASSGPQTPADDVVSAPAAPLPEYVPLPGSIVATEGIFVPVTVTTQREFVAQGGATITDTLQLKPGISGTTFAPGADRPIIRGLDSYRIRTQENGIGTHDVSAISEDHAIPVDPLSADRVEVVRGPATLRYGSQAIGGVVSVENERIPTASSTVSSPASRAGPFSSIARP
jgi:iron complex outermembrane receptor protein